MELETQTIVVMNSILSGGALIGIGKLLYDIGSLKGDVLARLKSLERTVFRNGGK